MPCTLWNNTAIVTHSLIKVYAFQLISVFITNNFYKFSTQ